LFSEARLTRITGLAAGRVRESFSVFLVDTIDAINRRVDRNSSTAVVGPTGRLR